MPYSGELGEDDPDRPLKDISTVYQYEFRTEPDSTMDLSHMMDNWAAYMLRIGSMGASGETLLAFMAIKNVNKEEVLRVTVPIVFK